MSDGHRNVVIRLCKVRSFYIIDCTNWMNLFNTIISCVELNNRNQQIRCHSKKWQLWDSTHVYDEMSTLWSACATLYVIDWWRHWDDVFVVTATMLSRVIRNVAAATGRHDTHTVQLYHVTWTHSQRPHNVQKITCCPMTWIILLP